MRLPQAHINGSSLLNALDSCGWDLSLQAPAISGHEETLDQLLLYMAEGGRRTDSPSWYNGWTAAHWAAYCGRDALGETAAHKAARIGELELISRLVTSGCDLSTVNVAGYTAFDVATMKGHASCAAYLQQAQHLQMKGLCPPYMPSKEVEDLCGTDEAANQPALMDCALPEDMVYGFVCVSAEKMIRPID